MDIHELKLRYGCNPHQVPARVFTEGYALPINVLNGNPGYINLCDGLNAWQLVKELRQTLSLPAAASFKHVSPSGAAVGIPLSDVLKKAYFVEDKELTPVAAAYIRARGADMMSSYGDWAALSDTVDEATALILKREVSDGIIAPAFEKEALSILKKKKNGAYPIIAIDPEYAAPSMERRQIFGITFEQHRNDLLLTHDHLSTIVTANTGLPESAGRDLLIALIGVKYTQSNSVCFAIDGQLIGVGAGQQSRIHCTRLAGSKADRWFLRQHPAVLGLPFKDTVGRTQRNNAIDQYLEDSLTPEEEASCTDLFVSQVMKLTQKDKADWRKRMNGISLASDGFFPFRDNIDRASQSGVHYIAQPGGSTRDDLVIGACDEYNMVMAFTKTRLFHH